MKPKNGAVIYFLTSLIIIFFCAGRSQAGYDGCTGIVEGYQTVDNPEPRYTVTVEKIFPSWDEYNIWKNEFTCPIGSRYDWGGPANNWMAAINPAVTQNWALGGFRCVYGNPQISICHVAMWPCGGEECYEESPVDSDGDGLMDNIDPYPDDPDPFAFEIVLSQGEPMEWLSIRTDSGDNFCYGEYDSDQAINIHADGQLHSSDFLEESTGELELAAEQGDILPSPQINNTYNEYNSYPGDDYTGTETDSELLGKVVNNTKAISDGGGSINNYLSDIREQNEAQNTILSKMLRKNAGGGIGIVDNSGVEDGLAGIEEAITEDYAGEGSSAGDYGSGLDLDGSMDSGGMPSQEIEAIEGQSWFISFLADNPYKAALDASGISAGGGVSSMGFSLRGHEYQFDLGDLQSEIQVAGNLLLALTGLISVIMIARGK